MWRWFVHYIISPGLPPLKKIAADKHVFAKLPLVTLFINNLTRLTAVVCIKVRFEAKVTRGFSLSPRCFRDSLSPLRSLLSLSRRKIKKNLWDQGNGRHGPYVCFFSYSRPPRPRSQTNMTDCGLERYIVF